MLGAFQNSPNPGRKRDTFVGILREYKTGPTAIANLVGFRFQGYQISEDQLESTPAKLYQLTAALISEELLTLEEVYCHLAPDDAAVVAADAESSTETKKTALKATISPEAMASLGETVGARNAALVAAGAGNQKLGLCEALLAAGNWDAAEAMMNRMPKFAAARHPAIRKRLCKSVRLLCCREEYYMTAESLTHSHRAP